ncbi:MAG TPA: NAD-dependent epimerase/dehydratase family protein [Gaiellales bacterium]|nr:NAD-dependent epimerase/dehydratase family protein [Gaiellales bacterium]
MIVLVTGASGFVGRSVVSRLRAGGHEVRPFSRAAGGNVTDPDALRRSVEGVDAIVHLVAILAGSDADFVAVNEQGTRNVVAAARDAGVRRLLHMSAAGVDERHAAMTRYWRTKYAGRLAVTGSGLDWTVFEPSFVFARGAGAFRDFEWLTRLPVTPVIGDGRYRHQPVWVGDVAAAFATALERPHTVGRSYQLGGPQLLEFDDLLDEISRVTGRRPHPKLHVPAGVMMLQARLLLHRLPPPLHVTPEQITMLLEGTECDLAPVRADLGLDPASLAEAYTR